MPFRKVIEILLCVSLIIFSTAATLAQNWDWIRQSKGTSTEIGRAITTDTFGNVYVAGIFESTVDISGDTLISAGSGDIFLCKYNAAGALIWSRRAGGSSLDRVMDITMDPYGDIVLTGGFNGKAGFSQDTLTSLDRDIFLCKYDENGNVLWARSAGGNNSDFGESLATDKLGNIYVTGSFNSDTLLIENEHVSKTGISDVFIAKYGRHGNFKWVQKGNASTSAAGRAIDTDLEGNVYITGHYQDTLDLQGIQLVGQDGQEVFILKYNPVGVLQWAKSATGTGVDLGQCILANIDHYFYVTGSFTGDIHFENTMVTSFGNYDMFLAKYDHAGKLIWVKNAGSNGPDNGWGLAHDAHQNIYLSGDFRDQITLGNITLTGGGNNDIFIAKYDVSGKTLWATRAGSPGSDRGYDVAYGKSGNLYVTGNFTGNASFDTTLVSSAGREDMFISRIIDLDSTAIPNAPYNVASGQVFFDKNTNCTAEGDDRGLTQWFLTATPGNYFTGTDANGKYEFQLDSGNYAIDQFLPQDRLSIISPICPTPGTQRTALFDTLAQSISGLDFSHGYTACAFLSVDISGGTRSACQHNITNLTYTNKGTDTAYHVAVTVTLPQWSTIISADLPYQVNGDGNIMFNIGKVAPFTAATFQIKDSVNCSASSLTGWHQAIYANISPENNCKPHSPNWSGASLEVTGSCMGGDTISAKIINTGASGMTDSTTFRIFLDDTLVYQDKVLLASGEDMPIDILAKGQTVRLESDQVSHHPTNKWVSTTLEGCGNATGHTPTLGYVSQFPLADGSQSETDVYSTTLTSSGMALSQTTFPTGRTFNHFIRSQTRITYTLGFQNTTQDTIVNLIIRDTLSQDLDLSTFQAGTASHPYKLKVTGKGQAVISFEMQGLYLTSGENGFVSFSMVPKTGLAAGTRIANQAQVYMDFASGVNSTPVFHTIKNTFTLIPHPGRVITCFDTPDVAIAGPGATFCGLDTFLLSANTPNNGKGSWHLISGAGTLDDFESPATTVRGLGVGDNIFEWRITACTRSTHDQVTLHRFAVPTKPLIQANGNLSLCEGDSVTLSGPSGYVYDWSQGNTTQDITIHTTSTWQLQVTDANGCTSELSDPVYVTVYAFPAVPLISQTNDDLYTSGSGTFQWFDSNGPIAGATGALFHPTQSGTYTVQVTNVNGCTTTSAGYQFITTSIDDELANAIPATVFPNPTTGQVTVKWENPTLSPTIRIWDAAGRLLKTKSNVLGIKTSFDISNEAMGLYMVEIKSETQIKWVKVIKK